MAVNPSHFTDAWKSLNALDRVFFVYVATFGLALWVTRGETARCAPCIALLLDAWPYVFASYVVLCFFAQALSYIVKRRSTAYAPSEIADESDKDAQGRPVASESPSGEG
ncbi:MAG: hypothetical protein HY719_06750 [Planctomycetes bacterium]|nr:hypothetical protein [Planctomycetota bacterium]